MRRTLVLAFYILMGAQIALGSVWAAGNFNAVQQFRENMGSIGPLALPMWAVSLIQLVLAAASTWYVLGKLGFRENKYVRGYVCAYLLTVPCLLQMHLARLAWSLSLSAFLWLSGLILEAMKSGVSKKRGLLIAAGLIFTASVALGGAFLEGRGSYKENTVGAALASRFVWPNFGRSYYFWPEKVKEVLSEEAAVELDMRADLVAGDFYPRLEEAYGKKEAIGLCLEMARECFKHRTRETAEEICRDFWDYLLLPFTIEKNLRGEGASMTAWNYGRMREHTPILTKYYYRYGTFALPFLLLGSLLLWRFRKVGRTGRFLLCVLILYTVWRTMGSNVPIDYKQALPILFVWHLAAVWGLREEEER